MMNGKQMIFDPSKVNDGMPKPLSQKFSTRANFL